MGMRTRTARRIRIAAVLAASALVAAACSDDAASPPSSGGNPFFAATEAAPVALVADRSCGEVLEGFQAFAPDVLAGQGFAASATTGDRAAAEESAPTAAGDGDDAAAGGAGTGGTSETNTQEEGIDEPDVVETDGEHVYVVDQDELVILDATSAAVVSRTRLGTYGSQLLLQGDRLLVLAGGMGYGISIPVEGGAAGDVAVDDVAEPLPAEGAPAEEVPPAPPTEPTPEPAPAPAPEPVLPEPEPLPSPVEPPSFTPGTVLQLLDVSDPAAPQVVQTTELEGGVVTARVVDGVARVVLTTWPDVQPLLEDVAAGGATAVAPAREALAESVGETAIGDWLPAFRTTVAGDDGATSEEGEVVACEDVLMPEVNAGISQTSILRVDFADGFDPADTTTVVAEATAVYASAERLYLAATRYATPGEDPAAAATSSTAVHAFDLAGDGAAAHVGAGEVPGHVLNQYSLSEHDGHLRIATTEWETADQPSRSAVRVLRLDGDRLAEVGAVTGLGLTETIQSVRFMGPVGYVVTFRQTDPLYVIDLSDPTAPRAVGELKIPGFSSYLHPVGDGRLVGIGRDADEEGRDRGLLVSLFDVRDPTAPAQLQTWTQADAWSQGATDPKAFLWWAAESIVAVPYERFGSGPVDVEGRPADQQLGILVLDVDDAGITERAVVTAEGRYPSRALVVDGRLWSLFEGGVVVSDLAAPASGTFSAYR